MYFYSLDKMVCPETLQYLKCEAFTTQEVENDLIKIKKCKDYCAFKEKNLTEVDELTCKECYKTRVISGKLTTKDGAQEYPIINGVPRMMLGIHLQRIFKEYGEFFKEFGKSFNYKKEVNPDNLNEFDKFQTKTQESFGNEWEEFSEIIPSYEDIFKEYFRAVDINDLKGKDLLDAGCGMGRWAFFAAKYETNVYAVDFSKAVDEAVKNLRGYSNAHVIQADIYNLPFKKEEFDIVYSLGVLHHLPNPFEGFKSVVEKAKKKTGGVLVYLYYALDNKSIIWRAILAAVTSIRRVTTKLPKTILYPLCFIMSVIFKVVFVIPAAILKSAGNDKLASNVPLNYYKDKSFKILYNDTIDRFSAPIENRYTRAQIKEWYKNAGISDCIIPDERPYWCAYGIRK